MLEVSSSHVVATVLHVQAPAPHRHHRSPRRQFRHGQRAAVIRAFTAARIYTNKMIPTLAAAAEACGSCVVYVRAANTLLKADNASTDPRRSSWPRAVAGGGGGGGAVGEPDRRLQGGQGPGPRCVRPGLRDRGHLQRARDGEQLSRRDPARSRAAAPRIQRASTGKCPPDEESEVAKVKPQRRRSIGCASQAASWCSPARPTPSRAAPSTSCRTAFASPTRPRRGCWSSRVFNLTATGFCPAIHRAGDLAIGAPGSDHDERTSISPPVPRLRRFTSHRGGSSKCSGLSILSAAAQECPSA